MEIGSEEIFYSEAAHGISNNAGMMQWGGMSGKAD